MKRIEVNQAVPIFLAADFTHSAYPYKKLSALYGLETSLSGMFAGFKKIKGLFKALKVIGLINTLANNDTAMHQLPGNFLIDENAVVKKLSYAKTTSDNLPPVDVNSFTAQYKSAV
jgi:hypothetical protein